MTSSKAHKSPAYTRHPTDQSPEILWTASKVIAGGQVTHKSKHLIALMTQDWQWFTHTICLFTPKFIM